MTAVRSFFNVSLSCWAATGVTRHASTNNDGARAIERVIMASSLSLQIRKFLRIREQSPDAFARRQDVGRELLIIVLQERQDLHHQQVVRTPQFRNSGHWLSRVMLTELVEQIIDLVLQRELRHEADRLGLLEARLERCEIEG